MHCKRYLHNGLVKRHITAERSDYWTKEEPKRIPVDCKVIYHSKARLISLFQTHMSQLSLLFNRNSYFRFTKFQLLSYWIAHLRLSRPAGAQDFQEPTMSSPLLSNYLPFELGVQGRDSVVCVCVCVKQMSAVSVMIICKSVVTRSTPQWRGRMRIASLGARLGIN